MVPANVNSAAPMAAPGPAPAAPNPAAGPSAAQSVPRFGGLRSGRPRKDGLVPGSPAALAADREKERVRKNAYRARTRVEDPPALPAAGARLVGAPPTAPAGPPGSGLAPLGADGAAPVPWDAATLKPLFEQLLPSVEQMTITRLTGRAAKGGLPGDVLKAIEDDARWSQPTKTALLLSGPQVTAKWLNKSGLSAENQPEVVFTTAVCSLVVSQMLLGAKLDKLIAETKKAPEPAKPEPAKPGAN